MEQRAWSRTRHDALSALSAIDAATHILEHRAEAIDEADRSEILAALRRAIEQLRALLDPAPDPIEGGSAGAREGPVG